MSRNATVNLYDIEYNAIVDGIAEGKIVPFLGAGFNLSDRPPETKWQPGSLFLPSGGELAGHLAEKYKYPLQDRDLARIRRAFGSRRGRRVSAPRERRCDDDRCAEGRDESPHVVLPSSTGTRRSRRRAGQSTYSVIGTT